MEADFRAQAEVIVRNANGLHGRPAAEFVRQARRFQADVRVQNLSRGGGPCNAKSLTDLLQVGANCGHRLRIIARGSDAGEAIEALTGLLGGEAAMFVETRDGC